MFHIKIKKIFLAALAFSLIFTTVVPAVFATDAKRITVTYPYNAFVEDSNNPWNSAFDALDATDTVEYSDAFFDAASPGDHPELRVASYALALAGFENGADGYPNESGEANPKLYNLLDQMGFSDSESWDTSSEADGHSFGTTIAHKTLANSQELVVVAPRNYNYLTEWLSNFNVGTSGDHAGFSEAANLVATRFDQYIADHNLENYKVWAVGYSRGGAVIDLFARRLNENIDSYGILPDELYVYTFGAPRASITETNYNNIHDVKDGNDLILGYVFPEAWGFYNTGVYEEVHPSNLEITTSVINITNLANPTTALSILADNDGITEQVDTMNGKDYMDEWMAFVIDNGLTREYFDTEVKPSLSALMKLYQSRTLDKQSEFLDFLKSTDGGLAGRVAGNAFGDLLIGGYGESIEEALSNFPPYLDLVKILKGTATDADVNELLTYLTNYMGDYEGFGTPVAITEEEFETIKDQLPKLVKALAPFIVADAKYTQETFGESYSLYYTYTLIDNIMSLVTGHIPESIMPILKSLIPIPKVPNTGKPTMNY